MGPSLRWGDGCVRLNAPQPAFFRHASEGWHPYCFGGGLGRPRERRLSMGPSLRWGDGCFATRLPANIKRTFLHPPACVISWSMDESPLLDFTPAPVRSRRDGWTAQRQRAFITHVAAGMPSNHAARAVGMSKQTAHALRRRPGAESFAAAWEAAAHRAALARRKAKGENVRTEAAVHGVVVPVMYRGRVVGSQIRYDNRQLVHLINQAIRNGAWP
jgi:hypothetical protein